MLILSNEVWNTTAIYVIYCNFQRNFKIISAGTYDPLRQAPLISGSRVPGYDRIKGAYMKSVDWLPYLLSLTVIFAEMHVRYYEHLNNASRDNKTTQKIDTYVVLWRSSDNGEILHFVPKFNFCEH